MLTLDLFGRAEASDAMRLGASFSPCRTWRYSLMRKWDRTPPLVVIGLNPSTADETVDDPTIRRCIGYARAWGMGGLWMLNLFAFRATQPVDLRRAADPIGPYNDVHLVTLTYEAPLVLCAWGTHGAFRERGYEVRRMLCELGRPLYHLGLTRDGHPRHPLYLRADLSPIEWRDEP